MADGIGDAAVPEDAGKTATATDDDEGHADGCHGGLGEAQYLGGGIAASGAEGPAGKHHGDQEGDGGVSDEGQGFAEVRSGGEGQFGGGCDQHEDHGEHDAEDGDAEAGEGSAGFECFRTFGCGRGFDVDAFDDEAGVDRAGDGGGGKTDDETPEKDGTHADPEFVGGEGGAGMGRHDAVHDGETGQQGKEEEEEGLPGLMGQGEEDGSEEDESDGEPGGESDGDGQRHDAELDPVRAEEIDEAFGEDFGPTGLGEEASEHGSQDDHGGDSAKGSAQSISEGIHHAQHGVTGDLAGGGGLEDGPGGVPGWNTEPEHRTGAHHQGGGGQRDEGIGLQSRDQQHEDSDRRQSEDHQFPIAGIHGCGGTLTWVGSGWEALGPILQLPTARRQEIPVDLSTDQGGRGLLQSRTLRVCRDVAGGVLMVAAGRILVWVQFPRPYSESGEPTTQPGFQSPQGFLAMTQRWAWGGGAKRQTTGLDTAQTRTRRALCGSMA